MNITKPKLLIVEGVSDKYFFEALLSNLSITDVEVLPIGGKSQLRDKLKALSYAPNFDAVRILGIVRDADNDPSGAFHSICEAFRHANLTVPDNQLVLTGTNPKTTTMILPAPEQRGMLEDVCLTSLQDAPEIECIERYFTCIQEKTNRQPSNVAKAKLYAYIAASNNPELRVGEAAAKGLFNWGHSSFDQIKRFLNLFFEN